MKQSDIKKMTNDEIEKKVLDLKKESMNLRFQMVSGQLENPARFRQIRREIAQMKTHLNQSQTK